MTKRDTELAEQAEAFADRDFKGEINWGEAYESKLIELVRADEREACAKVCEARGVQFYSFSEVAGECYGLAKAIRARGNT